MLFQRIVLSTNLKKIGKILISDITITGRIPRYGIFYAETQSFMFPRHLSFAETCQTKSWRFYQVLILMHLKKWQDLSLFGLGRNELTF